MRFDQGSKGGIAEQLLRADASVVAQAASAQIENTVTDRKGRPAAGSVVEDSKRQVLQRKIRLRIVGRLHPASLPLRTQTHPIPFKSSTGSSNEHDPKPIANSLRAFSI